MGYANYNKIQIILLQHYYKKEEEVFAVPSKSWQVFQSKEQTAAIIVTRPDIQAVETHREENSVFVNITTVEGELIVGSQYSRPRGNFVQDMSWMDHFSPMKNLILGGDLNVHLALLGYQNEDDRGALLTYLLLSKNLILLNDTEAQPTFIGEPNRPCKGTPDVTICTQDLSDCIDSWFVETEEASLSDHRYIHFSMSVQPKFITLKRFKTKHTTFKKFNHLFRQKSTELHESLLKLNSRLELDSWLQHFNDVLNTTCSQSLKTKTLRLYPTFDWWSDALRIQRNKISALRKRLKSTGDVKWREKLQRERALYKRQIKQEKLNSWQKFCTNTKNKFGQAFKIATNKNLKNKHFIHTTMENSSPYTSKTETFNNLLNHHFPIPENILPPLLDPAAEEDLNYAPPFSFNEIKYALTEQNNLKAPGYDKIDAFIIKNLFKNFKHLIREIFNTCLKFNYFPKNWKIATVVFFAKRNKDPKLLTSYRPICLLPMLGKIYERLIKHRLNYHLESNKYFHDSQFGFREGKSTIQILNKLKHKINKYLKTKKYCSLVSFDITGAFDNINWEILGNIIRQLPIPQYLKTLLLSFLSDREVITDYMDNDIKRTVGQGCPQGSCLGPLLWLLVANMILVLFYEKYTNLYAFCDDFNMVIKANSRRELEQIANDKINLFLQICQNLSLTISKEKTKFILLGKNKLQRSPIFKLDNYNIEKVSQIKILGIIFQENLKWDSHIKSIKSKIINLTSSIKRVFSATWGVDRSYLRTWYVTVLEKIIDYASEVWFEDLRIMDKRHLQSIQRLCLLSITKVYKNVANVTLQTLLGIPPILLTLQYKTHKYKILTNKDFLSYKEVAYTIDNIDNKIFKYETNPEIHINNLIKSTSILTQNDILKIYTDGSKVGDNVAYSYVAYNGTNKIYEHVSKLNKYNTIFQAELLAVMRAVDWALSTDFTKFQILSDSKSTINAITNLFPSLKVIQNLHHTLIANNNKLFYVTWIKGHSGIEGNEQADRLANEAAQYCDLPVEEGVKLPRSFLNNSIKSLLLDGWQYIWDHSEGGRFTHGLVPRVQLDQICRDKVSMYFLSGRGSFPTFLHQINKKDDDLCQCGSRGDPVHYLFGGCRYMRHKFKRTHKSIFEDIMQILNNNTSLSKLYQNYNILNEKYSFINYKFL